MKYLIWMLLAITLAGQSIAQQPIPNRKDSTSPAFNQEKEMDEVIIKSTRTSRTIRNTPTRIEIIDGEELDEKNNMRPANVSMLLHESTGILVQQTSATSANANIRVQGLDGRYTQILRDGYPNFGNFSSGLSILEIPPLDLKQVEIIKGPASTLYGAGAIAGVVNFISKEPGTKPIRNFLFNQSNIGQTNLAGFIAEKKGSIGFSLLAAINFQKAYDVDKDDFSELPRNHNISFHPGIYYYAKGNNTFHLSHQFTRSNITGGDMQAIAAKGTPGHSYFEKNSSNRNNTIFEWTKKINESNSVVLKQSFSTYKRQLNLPTYAFEGKSNSSYTDLSYGFKSGQHTVISGLSLNHNKFTDLVNGNQDNQFHIAGIYFQDTWDISQKLELETGLRADATTFRNPIYKLNTVFILPRISLLFRPDSKISSRLSGGLGYQLPSIFTEEAESIHYQNIQPLNGLRAEKSIGATADFNYRSKLGSQLELSYNQLFFITRIGQPAILVEQTPGNRHFENASKPIISKGFESNLKLIFRESLKLFAGYTFTDAKATYNPAPGFLFLLPKHKLNLVLVYEKENNFKMGLETYFSGKQFLSNGSVTPDYWEMGFMAQKSFGSISLFLNFENFTDERQSKYKQVPNPPHDNPGFDEIWNHTEGRTINGGIKVQF